MLWLISCNILIKTNLIQARIISNCCYTLEEATFVAGTYLLINYTGKVVTIDKRNQAKISCQGVDTVPNCQLRHKYSIGAFHRGARSRSNNERTAEHAIKEEEHIFHNVKVVKAKERLTIPR